jgi:hypothetical protein
MDGRDDIDAVLARRTPALMAIPGVVGTGEGREGTQPVIVVFVAGKSAAIRESVPRELEGWRVVLREVGDVSAPPG